MAPDGLIAALIATLIAALNVPLSAIRSAILSPPPIIRCSSGSFSNLKAFHKRSSVSSSTSMATATAASRRARSGELFIILASRSQMHRWVLIATACR